MKERIFVGSQTKQLFEDHDFSTKSHSPDRRPWNVCKNFLGHEKAENLSEIVQELISS